MAALFVSSGGEVHAVPLHQAPMLDAASVPKYRAPLLVPTAMPRSSTGAVDYYEIGVRQFAQQILPAGLPATTVWGYGSARAPGTFHYPASPSRRGSTARCGSTWINDLVTADRPLPAAPAAGRPDAALGQPARRRRRPGHPPRRSPARPGPTAGPVPDRHPPARRRTPHEESDGYPEAWYLPAARNIPRGYARVGSFYDRLPRECAQPLGVRPGARARRPSSTRNDQRGRHPVVPRPRARHDPGQRLRRAGRLLPAARRRRTTCRRRAARPRATRRRAPGGATTRSRWSSRTAPSTRTARCSSRPAATSSTTFAGPVHARHRRRRRSGTRSSSATPWWSTAAPGRSLRGRAAALPVPPAQRLQLPVPHAQGRRQPAGRPAGPGGAADLADRRRRRLPAARRSRLEQLPAGPRRARRRHRRLHRHPRRAPSSTSINEGPDEPFGGGEPGDRLRARRPGDHRSGHALHRRRPGRRTTPASAADQLSLPGSRRPGVATRTRRLSLNEADSDVLPGVGPRAAMLGTVDGDVPVPLDWADAGHREPAAGRDRDLGAAQLHRGRPPDPHAPGAVRGARPPALGGAGPAAAERHGSAGTKDTVIAYPARSPGSRRSSTCAGLLRRGTATSSSTRTTR